MGESFVCVCALDAAAESNKKGFRRGAGAVVGVVLEGHLRTICAQHKITAPKNAMLGKLNDLLKENNVIEIQMTEVRYVRGGRQEQERFLYCSEFMRGDTSSIHSHRYLDTFLKWLSEKNYRAVPMEL